MSHAASRPILGVRNGERLALELWHTPRDSVSAQQRTLLCALRPHGPTALALPLASAVLAGILVDAFLDRCRRQPMLILWQPDHDGARIRRPRALAVLNQLADAGVPVLADGWSGSASDQRRHALVPGLWGVRLAPHLLSTARRASGVPAMSAVVSAARSRGMQTVVPDATIEDLPLLQQLGVEWSCPPTVQLLAAALPALVA